MRRKQTYDAARLFGIPDRGLLRPGLRANLNLIDYPRLNVRPPRYVHDLPSQAGRLLQDAVGYLATIVGGTITREQGRDTGERPGQLIRGTR